MSTPEQQPKQSRVRLALVHHANQYLITDGYEERDGMGDILGLGGGTWRGDFHRRGLLPLLQMHLDYRVPLNLHLSGTLIESLAWHYPECFALVRRLLRARLLEVVGSTFSQNVMPFFSDDYNLSQLNEELWLLRRHLGCDPVRVKTFWVPERVWDTEKMAHLLTDKRLLNGGYRRVLLDDRILYPGGDEYPGSARERFDRGQLIETETFRHWEVAGGGGLSVLPISKHLRYCIPPPSHEAWNGLHALFGWLAEAGDAGTLAVYGDDMERAAGVGGWEPGHSERYEQFLRWLAANDWIEPVLVNEWAEAREPAGVLNVERGTFYELAQQWRAGEDYRGWVEDPHCQTHRQFFLGAERSLAEAGRRGADRGLLELGWKHLLHSSYETNWHDRANDDPANDYSKLYGGRRSWLAPWAAALSSHARACHVIARAAEWRAVRDGRAHAEVFDIDGDGEDELVLKNDRLFAVFSPVRGGRLVYLFDLSGREGRLVVGNISDDWNLQEEVNRYMDCPRNHPGAFAEVGHEHDRYRVEVGEHEGGVAARMLNVEPESAFHGGEKRVSLSAEDSHLCVVYGLPDGLWRLSTEVSLSPDYYRMLRHGRGGLREFNGRDWRGWSNGAARVWARIDPRQSTIWDKPFQAESGHALNLRVTSFSKTFRLELGVGRPSPRSCSQGANGHAAARSAAAMVTAATLPFPKAAWDAQAGKEYLKSAARAGLYGRPDAADATAGVAPDMEPGPQGSAGAQADFRELVTDPHFMRNFLGRRLYSARRDRLHLRACRVRVLRPHHDKLTLEYNLQLRPGRNEHCYTQTMVGTWRQDGRNAAIHELLAALWDEGFDEASGLAVARTVGHWESLHLRLRERVAGKLLRELLYHADTEWSAPLRRIGAWLAKLHGAKASVSRRFDPRAEAENLAGWLADMRACDRPWIAHERERVAELMGELIGALSRPGPREVCLTHGDFHPENIFLRGKTVTVIDFEQSEMGDPASDVGYLLGEMDIQSVRYWARRECRSPLDVRLVADLLLSEYARRRRPPEPRRVQLYLARTYLKHLMHTVRMMGEEDPRSVTLWLDRAGECLRAARVSTRRRVKDVAAANAL